MKEANVNYTAKVHYKKYYHKAFGKKGISMF